MVTQKKNKGFRSFSLKYKILRVCVICLIVLFTTSFRVMLNSDSTVSRWYVTRNKPTVWLKFCNEEISFDGNNLPGSDPFYGGGTNFQDVLQSIIDDVNNVSTSYLRLAFYPDDPDNPPIPEPGDTAFTREEGKIKTVDICFGGLPYYASAQALTITNENVCESIGDQAFYRDYCDSIRIYNCEIKINKDYAKESMKGFVSTLTHELGHCLGFMHNHDTHKSIMSYVADNSVVRLQMDDKMGLTYLYPIDDDYNDEEPTYGLTGCE